MKYFGNFYCLLRVCDDFDPNFYALVLFFFNCFIFGGDKRNTRLCLSGQCGSPGESISH